MDRKQVKIQDEREKYEFIVNPAKKSGKAQQLQEGVITTSLYLATTKCSGFATSQPILWLEAFEKLYTNSNSFVHWLNTEDKNGKFCESQIYLYNRPFPNSILKLRPKLISHQRASNKGVKSLNRCFPS